MANVQRLIWLCLALLLDISSCQPVNNVTHMTRTEVVQKLLETYDNRIPPSFNDEDPVTVTCIVYVSSISNVDEPSMSYSVTLFLRQYWEDSRLGYSHLSNASVLTLDPRMSRDIWSPDLYFTNQKNGNFHEAAEPYSIIRLSPNGTVSMSMRISLTLDCPMELRTFPLDSQTCAIDMETIVYSEDTLRFVWSEQEPLEINPGVKLSQYLIINQKVSTGTKSSNIGNFTTLHVHFLLRRDIGYYLIQAYIPTAMVVLLSWVGFWIDAAAVPARISLSVTAVLTMTTQSSGMAASLPKVSYIKAIDVWMLTCSIFVFAALLEFAFVNVLLRQETKRRPNAHAHATARAPAHAYGSMPKPKAQQDEATIRENGIPLTPTYGMEQEMGHVDQSDDNAEQGYMLGCCGKHFAAFSVDKVSRKLFPVTFILFNVVYWTVYWFLDKSIILP